MSLRTNMSSGGASTSVMGGLGAIAIVPSNDTEAISPIQQRASPIAMVNNNQSHHEMPSRKRAAPTPAPHPTLSAESEAHQATEKLSATAITVIMVPLCLSVFLSALDLTVVTPAIPAIVSSFESMTGYVWIGSAFILSSTASTPIWGSVADIWGRKPVLLIALSIFLIGSLLCALAPRLDVLIAGRAVQGLGSSGMGIMVNVIICDTFSLRDRGLYLAITSVVWAVGSAVGPIIGGAFTTKLTWRWCFWLNLPIGAIVFFVLLFSLKLPSPNTPVLAGLQAIDWAGSLLIVGVALMILLGLDFENVIFPWSSATVICLIAFGIVTIAVFIVNEWKFASNPVIPLRLFSSRSTVAAYLVWACNFYVLVGLSYYLPLFSQSVLGANALMSGVQLIPLIVSCSLAAACVGAFIQKTGVYLPITYVAHAALLLGTGLLINLKSQATMARLVAFEIITGIGVGMNMEPPTMAAQAAMAEQDTAAVQATMTFIRSLATTIAVVVGGVIFQNQMNAAAAHLVDQVGEQVARQFDGKYAAANVGLIEALPKHQQQFVKNAFLEALRADWIMFVAVAGFSLLCNLAMRSNHLSNQRRSVVLGVDRMARVEREPGDLQTGEQVELRDLQANHSPST